MDASQRRLFALFTFKATDKEDTISFSTPVGETEDTESTETDIDSLAQDILKTISRIEEENTSKKTTQPDSEANELFRQGVHGFVNVAKQCQLTPKTLKAVKKMEEFSIAQKLSKPTPPPQSGRMERSSTDAQRARQLERTVRQEELERRPTTPTEALTAEGERLSAQRDADAGAKTAFLTHHFGTTDINSLSESDLKKFLDPALDNAVEQYHNLNQKAANLNAQARKLDRDGNKLGAEKLRQEARILDGQAKGMLEIAKMLILKKYTDTTDINQVPKANAEKSLQKMQEDIEDINDESEDASSIGTFRGYEEAAILKIKADEIAKMAEALKSKVRSSVEERDSFLIRHLDTSNIDALDLSQSKVRDQLDDAIYAAFHANYNLEREGEEEISDGHREDGNIAKRKAADMMDLAKQLILKRYTGVTDINDVNQENTRQPIFDILRDIDELNKEAGRLRIEGNNLAAKLLENQAEVMHEIATSLTKLDRLGRR